MALHPAGCGFMRVAGGLTVQGGADRAEVEFKLVERVATTKPAGK